MIRFDNDYTGGGHPDILKNLSETNDEQLPGYGLDYHSANARKLIKKSCGRDDIDVHFMVGGTQTNTTIISSVLRTHQGVISANTGHIAKQETGAVEATGHKVLEITSEEGKITAEQVDNYIKDHWDNTAREHTVQPKLLYITQPTELGTLYDKTELENLYQVCKKNNLYLMIDGARLGYGLVSKGNNLTLKDISRMSDIFYIGGTKVGALFGEAVVIVNNDLKNDFRYIMKQGGGLLAKGRLLGIQFETLFNDGLYYTISEHAIEMAQLLKAAFKNNGFDIKYTPSTNQIFVHLSERNASILGQNYTFSVWEKNKKGSIIARFCTSWSTEEDDVEKLIEDIEAL